MYRSIFGPRGHAFFLVSPQRTALISFLFVAKQLKNAVEEQRKITQLRFTRLLADTAAAAATTITAAGCDGCEGGEANKHMCGCSRI